MSVILKHVVEFPQAGITVSNDLFLGTLILNAEVKAEIFRDHFGSYFEITFDEMPLSSANKLGEAKSDGLTARIHLGYFDALPIKPPLVMTGVVTKVEAKPDGGKLKTKVTGFETTTQTLREVKAADIGCTHAGASDVPLATVLDGLIGDVVPNGAAYSQPGLGQRLKLDNPACRGETLLEVLADVVSRATGGSGRAQMFAYDGRVTVGLPLAEVRQPWLLDPGINLAEFAPFKKKVESPEGTNRLEPLPAGDIKGFNFTVAGEPEMRPAQPVTPLVTDFDPVGPFRIHSVVHEYGKAGYKCRGRAVAGTFDTEPVESRAASAVPSSRAIVASLSERIKNETSRPHVETGVIKALTANQPQRVEAYYHQRFASSTTQPSVTVDVDRDERKVLRNVPVISSFAWHKTGLVTPVYPGMKTVLVHNLGLPGDALVAGSTWSDAPAFATPAANPGDWWLCLPVDAEGTGADGLGPPADATKAVNDLTSKSGERVIETKSLRIRVGADLLRAIGTRPEPGAADECLIEHTSGTKVRIDPDGKVSIEASTVTIKGKLEVDGDVAITGNLEVG